jgi:hypothetical protein
MRRYRDLCDALAYARRVKRFLGFDLWILHGDDPEPEWEDDQPGYFWVVDKEEAEKLIAQGYEGFPASDLDEEAPPLDR